MNEAIHNLDDWLEDHRDCFQPPICAKTMYIGGQLIAFFVGGPNAREDYHLEEGDEFFYQIKGDMNLKVIENDIPKNLYIKEGEVFLLPKRIAHSPQRFKDTLGFVVERRRNPEEMDCVRYYTDNYTDILYEKWLHLDNFKQISSIIENFMKSKQRETGRPIPGTILENPPFHDDNQRILDKPFSLKLWIEKHRAEIESRGKKELFEGDYTFKAIVYGKGRHEECHFNADTVLWQLEKDSKISMGEKDYTFRKNSVTSVKSGQKWRLSNEDSAFTLSVTTFSG